MMSPRWHQCLIKYLELHSQENIVTYYTKYSVVVEYHIP